MTTLRRCKLAFGLALCLALVSGPVSAGLSVPDIAFEEWVHVSDALGIPTPPVSLVTQPEHGGGYMIPVYPGTRYVIVLLADIWRRDRVRYVAAHEIGHAYLLDAGLPIDEGQADFFAWCFGSEGAQTWSSEAWDYGDCGAFGEFLRGRLLPKVEG